MGYITEKKQLQAAFVINAMVFLKFSAIYQDNNPLQWNLPSNYNNRTSVSLDKCLNLQCMQNAESPHSHLFNVILCMLTLWCHWYTQYVGHIF